MSAVPKIEPMVESRGQDRKTEGAKAELSQALAEIVGDFVDAVGIGLVRVVERVGEAARDPVLRMQVQAGMAAVKELIGEELERYEKDPRSYLYDEMLAGTAVVLIAKVRTDDESFLLDGLESAFFVGPLAQEAQAAVAESPPLSNDQRQRLLHGFEQLALGRWIPACDALLTGTEGMIWDAAVDGGVIDADRRLTDVSKRKRVIKSVNGLLDAETIGGLRPSYRLFLNRQIFGAAGNDLRHGRSGRDARATALFAAVAVLGWLDHVDGTELMARFANNLDRFVDQVAAELEAEQRLSEASVPL
jgi:hypothetical protein